MLNVLKNGIKKEIDFETLVDELAKKDLIFIEDCHFGKYATAYAENQMALIKAILSKEKFVVALEYDEKSGILEQHKPILSLHNTQLQYLGIPNLEKRIREGMIGFWDAMKEFNECAAAKLKKNIEKNLKTIVICGGDHVNHDSAIPFKLNGNSQIGIVCQDPAHTRTQIYKVIKISEKYLNKGIYEILGEIK